MSEVTQASLIACAEALPWLQAQAAQEKLQREQLELQRYSSESLHVLPNTCLPHDHPALLCVVRLTWLDAWRLLSPINACCPGHIWNRAVSGSGEKVLGTSPCPSGACSSLMCSDPCYCSMEPTASSQTHRVWSSTSQDSPQWLVPPAAHHAARHGRHEQNA